MKGKVWLVGAGPGDPELITVRGREALAMADVVVYDESVNPEFLDTAPESAEVFNVGQQPPLHPIGEAEVVNLLVHHARRGKQVVRLCGGDPFVFGPGVREAEALAAANLTFEIVPGVTSSVAAPAFSGIPILHPDIARSYAVLSGDEMGTAPEARIDWSNLATGTDTLVLAWAAGNLPTVTRLLIEHGRDPSTPVAVVAWGADVRQQTVVGTLADIADRVAEADVQSPAITVVGEVVRLRERLRWYDDRPLFGRRVLVTRTRHGASEIRRLLQAEGAEVIELPTHDVVDAVAPELFDRVMQALDEERYGWLIFSSPRSVELFFRHLRDLGRDSRALRATKVATVGLPTSAAIAEHGIVPDVAIELPSTDAILARLPQRELSRRRVLLPRAEESQHDLLRALRRLGAEVEDVPMFVSAVRLAPDRDALAKLRRHEIDAVVFPASSAVTSLVRMLGGDLSGLQSARVACIGPITAEVALQAGMRVDTVADPPTPAGVVRALAKAMQRAPATA